MRNHPFILIEKLPLLQILSRFLIVIIVCIFLPVSLIGWFLANIRPYKNVPNKLISIFVIASCIETTLFESLNSWLKQIVFTSHFMMEEVNLIPILGGYNLEIFVKNDVEKYKCYICGKVMKDAIQLPHLVHPKRTCLTCYKANIR